MNNIFTHKKTKQRLLLKKDSGLISTLYVLDEKDNKIIEKNDRGFTLLNVKGKPRHKLAICLTENLF